MVVKILRNGKTYNQLSILSLSANERFGSTKKPVSKGKWYYEATHFSGNLYNYWGFKHVSSANQTVFFPFASLSHPTFYSSGIFKYGDTYSHDAGFSIENQHTVGVGIDIDAKTFSIFYNDIIKTFDIPDYKEGTTFGIDFGVASTTNIVNEVMSVNFGAAPFVYKHDGYKAWSEPLSFSKCIQKRTINNMFLTYIFLIFNS